MRDTCRRTGSRECLSEAVSVNLETYPWGPLFLCDFTLTKLNRILQPLSGGASRRDHACCARPAVSGRLDWPSDQQPRIPQGNQTRGQSRAKSQEQPPAHAFQYHLRSASWSPGEMTALHKEQSGPGSMRHPCFRTGLTSCDQRLCTWNTLAMTPHGKLA